MNITFIGGGNMARALMGGLLQQGWEPARIRVSDIDPAARARIGSQFGVSTHDADDAGA